MTSNHSQFSKRTDTAEEKIDWEQAQQGARLLLEAVGEDPDRDELIDTWQRRVPETFATLTEGDREPAKPTIRTFDADSDGLVVKTDIPVYSLCEHHLLPFFGTVNLAYRPDESVVGLSKLTRYVRWQSRSLTMQERLTNDIASGLADELDAPAVLVEMNATHLCEAMRGIETESTTTTRATIGELTEPEREQFRAAVTRTEGRL
ncbi:GTP cyclohydrolase I [Candidatus Halobonum tyrrellensis]|uniref:GTP cyclohydrolase I n=1 Tax=Candidatus Halobonum tyrrellensis G22 TaxID=1324957 RepID=V4GNA5_9EURY|nr:GTP cyclohydrolase I FolE [Candidatus Halobonum tyrrellensis]ESP86856.1 GTP cyclohydrolase I [Candidatus Halobonum tyrrellensis G22]